MPVQIRDKQIEETIIVIIAPGAAIPGGVIINEAATDNFLECPVSPVFIEEIFDSGSVGLSVRHEEIEVSIIVEIGPGRPPGKTHLRSDDGIGDSGK